LQVSEKVQAFPSLQAPLVRVVEVHVAVPLQLKVTHELGSVVQVTGTWWHVPPGPEQLSTVHGLLSSHVEDWQQTLPTQVRP
jgi:hypothetical protein